MTLHTLWPWVGLILAVVLLALLSFTDRLRGDRKLDRWRDLQWLAWLFLPVYMLHQFEEHGIDLLGRAYAFRASMCGIFGYATPEGCPIPEAFLTAVNLAVVWAAGLLAALWGRKRPLLIPATYGILFINGVTHISPAILRQRYNPGVLTAVILFFPLGVWVVRTSMRTPGVGVPGVIRLFAAGGLVHLVLMGSLALFVHGRLSVDALLAINVLNAAVPCVVAFTKTAPSRSRL